MIGNYKLIQQDGISRIVVVIFLVAILLVGMIFYPIVMKSANNRANEVDAQYITTATKEAQVQYLNNYKGFTAVFDTETKQFVDESTAKKTVNPYGTSEEHQGKYLLITVDDSGNVSSEWVTP
jgi:type III secretory pathway component EscR